ncbi:MAG: hypothetical protein ACYS19_18245, partial [Planctomycetota bacterium]
ITPTFFAIFLIFAQSISICSLMRKSQRINKTFTTSHIRTKKVTIIKTTNSNGLGVHIAIFQPPF